MSAETESGAVVEQMARVNEAVQGFRLAVGTLQADFDTATGELRLYVETLAQVPCPDCGQPFFDGAHWDVGGRLRWRWCASLWMLTVSWVGDGS